MTGRQQFLYFLTLHRTGLAVTLMAAALLLFPLVEDNPYTLGLTNLIIYICFAVTAVVDISNRPTCRTATTGLAIENHDISQAGTILVPGTIIQI